MGFPRLFSKVPLPPPEKSALPLGSKVELHEDYDGNTVGEVKEYLGTRKLRGVQHHWYALIFPDGDYGDFGDFEFDPL